MPAPTLCAATRQALTANGTATGTLTVTSTTGFVAGATVFIYGSGKPTVQAVIKEVVSATVLTVQIITVPDTSVAQLLRASNYGLSDVSTYTTAATSGVYQPKQNLMGGDPLYSSAPA